MSFLMQIRIKILVMRMSISRVAESGSDYLVSCVEPACLDVLIEVSPGLCRDNSVSIIRLYSFQVIPDLLPSDV
jgi:hypothetical protein